MVCGDTDKDGHRTGKGPFSFQSQRRAMPKDVQTTVQLCSFYMLIRLCSKSFKLGFSRVWTVNFQMFKLDLEKAEEQEIKLQHPLDHRKSKRIAEKHLLLLHWLCQSLCVDHNKLCMGIDGNTRPPYLPPEKPVCRSRSNISNCMWDNRLVPNWEWSTSRVYIVSLLI